MNAKKSHFDRLPRHYRVAARTWQPIYRQSGELLNRIIRDKVVLDVGHGGVFAYDPQLPRQIIVMDSSLAMLDGTCGSNMRLLEGDARDLRGVDDGSIDVAVFMLLLHHVTGRNLAETNASLNRALSAAFKKLCIGGEFFVVEPVIRNRLLHRLQETLFPLTSSVLCRLRVGMVFFHRLDVLRTCMAECFRTGIPNVGLTQLAVTQSVDPLGGTFPGLLRIPPWMRPTHYYLLRVRKPG